MLLIWKYKIPEIKYNILQSSLNFVILNGNLQQRQRASCFLFFDVNILEYKRLRLIIESRSFGSFSK